MSRSARWRWFLLQAAVVAAGIYAGRWLFDQLA